MKVSVAACLMDEPLPSGSACIGMMKVACPCPECSHRRRMYSVMVCLVRSLSRFLSHSDRAPRIVVQVLLDSHCLGGHAR